MVQNLLNAKKALKLEALLKKLDRYSVVALYYIGYVLPPHEPYEYAVRLRFGVEMAAAVWVTAAASLATEWKAGVSGGSCWIGTKIFGRRFGAAMDVQLLVNMHQVSTHGGVADNES